MVFSTNRPYLVLKRAAGIKRKETEPIISEDWVTWLENIGMTIPSELARDTFSCYRQKKDK